MHRIQKVGRRILTAFVAMGVLGASVPSAVSALTAATFSAAIVTASTDSVTLTEAAGAAESAYVEWSTVTDAEGYNVYVDGTQIDSMLIRQYESYFRTDAVGLTAGSHTLKIVPVIDGTANTSKAAEMTVSVATKDRSGFASVDFGVDIGEGVFDCGGYQTDGTLSADAQVLYVTADTVNTVTLDVITNSKGTTTTYTGLANILSGRQKGYDMTPLVIRMVGEITADDIDGLNSSGYLQVKGVIM